MNAAQINGMRMMAETIRATSNANDHRTDGEKALDLLEAIYNDGSDWMDEKVEVVAALLAKTGRKHWLLPAVVPEAPASRVRLDGHTTGLIRNPQEPDR